MTASHSQEPTRQGNEISASEQRLSAQLEAILSRPPARGHNQLGETESGSEGVAFEDFESDGVAVDALDSLGDATLDSEADKETDALDFSKLDAKSRDGSRADGTAFENAANDAAGFDAEAGGESDAGFSDRPSNAQPDARVYRDLESVTLVKSARRARRRKRVTQFGSWVITLSVTVFIIACVSVMLLGLPSQFDPRTWVSAQASPPAMGSAEPAASLPTTGGRAIGISESGGGGQ